MTSASQSQPISRGIYMSLALAVITFLVFDTVRRNGFVDYDDPIYLTENPNVKGGVTATSINWAFTTFYASFWHPVTWLSHMLDWQLHRSNPSGHHATALVLHVGSVILVFWVFWRMTGAYWRSALVAAFFSLHPLHVEPVAWASARKDVLSTFFWLLTMLGYSHYCQRSKSRSSSTTIFYVMTLLFFALGLMSKPMLVTLPFALLLLDFWPLKRMTTLQSWKPLIIEKLPFFLMAAIGCFVAYQAQTAAGGMATAKDSPWSERFYNVLMNYTQYLYRTAWPARLTIIYPFPKTVQILQLSIAIGLLIALTAGAWHWRRSHPYFWIGWCWYLGTLVPVIGFLPVGTSPLGDRYTYVPLIGIFVACIWGGYAFTRTPVQKMILLGVASLLLIGCAMLTRKQIAHWRDTETLFAHGIAVTKDNYFAHYNLAKKRSELGKIDEALMNYQEALRIDPKALPAHMNIATIYGGRGQFDEARHHLEQVLALDPKHAEAHYNIGVLQSKRSKTREAIRHYEMCLKSAPEHIGALNNLASIRAAHAGAEFRDGTQAMQLARRACEITRYEHPHCLDTLAAACAETGDFPNAVKFAGQARDVAVAMGQSGLVQNFDKHLALFRSGRPLRASEW